ncbi:AraC family transcriptional regulator [Paenibacillus aurantius]|uniref:AraC family transcriptional regulator n=1 Tax=Paenibacillus aurantius TaxID=2918900 RepID=A0AA96RH95_9BACL|nr:AraC family transcriptional regulator [Paenibacillus aurantius]WNQ13316.1 AraC family transcriptional regulator [Paenibacillus aurantius]
MNTALLICGYSYHSQPFGNSHKNGLKSYLFRLQTEGRSKVRCRDKEYPLQAGDLVLLQPGDDYDLVVEEEDGRVASGDYYLLCEGPWIEEWWSRSERPPVTRIVPDDQLLGLWRSLVQEKNRSGEENTELADCLLRALCLFLDRAVSETLEADGASFVIRRLKRFIEENATSSFKVEQAAHYAGISVSRAVHLFKALYGKTMIQYAIEIRLHAAVERMKYSTMTLEKIAETCGFASYSYFHRVFRSHFGLSPAAYRARGGGTFAAASEGRALR